MKSARLFPMFLNLKGKRCLIIGGGLVAYRKLKSLIECGAEVTMVSQGFCQSIYEFQLMNQSQLKLQLGMFDASVLSKFYVVISADGNREKNREVFRECERIHKFVNCVDQPDFCSFYYCSVINT